MLCGNQPTTTWSDGQENNKFGKTAGLLNGAQKSYLLHYQPLAHIGTIL